MEVAVAEAQLVTAQLGEKPEIVKQAEIQIEAIERELSTLGKRLSDYTLTAPINGNIQKVLSPDTLLLVTDDTRIVLIPVSWQFLNDVDTNLKFSIETKYNSNVLEGSIDITSQIVSPYNYAAGLSTYEGVIYVFLRKTQCYHISQVSGVYRLDLDTNTLVDTGNTLGYGCTVAIYSARQNNTVDII